MGYFIASLFTSAILFWYLIKSRNNAIKDYEKVKRVFFGNYKIEYIGEFENGDGLANRYLKEGCVYKFSGVVEAKNYLVNHPDKRILFTIKDDNIVFLFKISKDTDI